MKINAYDNLHRALLMKNPNIGGNQLVPGFEGITAGSPKYSQSIISEQNFINK